MENEFKIKSAMFECFGEVLEYVKRNKSYYTHMDVDDDGNEIHSEPTIEKDGDYTYYYYQAWHGIELFFRELFK